MNKSMSEKELIEWRIKIANTLGIDPASFERVIASLLSHQKQKKSE